MNNNVIPIVPCPLLTNHTQYPVEKRGCEIPDTRIKQIEKHGFCHNGTVCLCQTNEFHGPAVIEMIRRIG